MKVVTRPSQLPKRPRILAIGTFDGVHVGHQKILAALVRRARRERASSVVLTFPNHPQMVLKPRRPMPMLLSLALKVDLIREQGVDYCYLADFNRRFYSQEADAFVRGFVLGKLGVRHLVVGYDFKFGKGRGGDVELLKRLSRERGFGVTIVPPVRRDGGVVSSTRIRGLIERGDLTGASRLLGRPYRIAGKVVRGAHRGGLTGYHTANVVLEGGQAPAVGVYAARVRIGLKESGGMVNVGFRPTFVPRRLRPHDPTVEVHVFDLDRNLYGNRIEVELLKRIRGEHRFPTAEALRRQLNHDEQAARQICSN
ncbi:MAG: bifunctional riboflavin kinase/FAD synthetase [Candidatus Omnitrophica bacterium]|nr:bifunctional riboflavin kinase/FAD synthetase [Candidatus Omnitrophota bacterium]